MVKSKAQFTPLQKRQISQRVTIFGSIADAILGFLKIFIGLSYHSQALVIDGIHSFTDVFSDIFVIFITRLSHEGPDENHPYGHEKFETIGSAALGSILIATGGALIYETVKSLWSGGLPPTPGTLTYYAAGISLVVKEFLFHYTYRAGEKIESKLVMANAWHSRTDALSSLVVLIGLIFSGFGFTIVDNIAALIVSLIIAKVGWDFVKESLVELAETSASDDLENKIRDIILKVEGVESCHALRTRTMGHKVLLDVNIEVDAHFSASEGHEISAWVIKNLKESIKEVEDVTVHIDVEDDRNPTNEELHAHDYNNLLPLRTEVLSELGKYWSEYPLLKDALGIRLHYIKRKVIVEIVLPLALKSAPLYSDPNSLESLLDERARGIKWYGKTTLLFGRLGY